jgi:ParB family chromosome partitioning protein
VPESDRKLDHDLACSIAESARIVGFIQPIAVRKVKVERGSKVRMKIAVIAGAHRLQAARLLGHERIDCKFIENDDETFAQLVQIGEQLFRKHLTVLSQSELVMKWYELVFADRVSGQDGQKRKRGRPRGGDSEAARTLPIGRSEHARRKIIQRAKKIAGITPEAKTAATDAGLAGNQKALWQSRIFPAGRHS